MLLLDEPAVGVPPVALLPALDPPQAATPSAVIATMAVNEMRLFMPKTFR